MHRTNHHTYKPAYVGRVRADGQFDILCRSRELVEPQAFSPYLKSSWRRELKKRCRRWKDYFTD